MVKPLANLARLQGPATLGEAAANQLRESIVSGALPPGTLLKDAQIAAQLGLSPIPLREAMVQLASEGLIEIEANRLKRVTPIDHDAMVELLQVQNNLWELGYKWGAPNINAADIATLKLACARQNAAIAAGDITGAISAASAFHLVLMKASGNRELVRVSVDRLPLIQRYVLLCAPWIVSAKSAGKHLAMLKALQRGDAEKCQSIFEKTGKELLDAVISVRDDAATKQAAQIAKKR